jgi:subtilase family serine protease
MPRSLFLGTRPVPALSAGQVSTVTTSFPVPPATPVSRYYVLAKSDHGSVVTEVSETNNVRMSASIPIGPDLIVLALGAPSTVVRGTSFTITDTTRNAGGASPQTATSYYLSANSTLDASDVLLGSHPVGALLADGAQNGQATVVVPPTQAAGNYYIIAKADGGDLATEISETNNVNSKTIKVNP